MNVFAKITLAGLKKNRGRTAVTIIGIILSVALITGVASFISSLHHFLLEDVIATQGNWQVYFSGADDQFLEMLTTDREVERVALVEEIGYAILEGGQNPSKPYLYFQGFSEEAFETLPLTLTEGRMPENNREVLMPLHVASNGRVEYHIGDTLTLELGNRILDGLSLDQNSPFMTNPYGQALETFERLKSKIYTVVGLVERPPFENHSASGYTVITTLDPEDSTNLGAYVSLNRPSQVSDFLQRVGGGQDYALNTEYLRLSGITGNDNMNRVLGSLGAIMIVLIMVGSVLLIHNSFSISISERTKQFGMLSSVGATGKQLRKSVLFEGMYIGLVGIPLGILAGVAGVGITLVAVSEILRNMITSGNSISLHISPIPLVLSAVLGVATIFISAYIPAWRVSKQSAIDSIRQSADIKIKAKTVKTSKISERIFGLEGVLAQKNFKRNKKQYRSTIISLFVSIVLFVSVSAFGMFMRESAESVIGHSNFDFSLQMGMGTGEQNVFQIYNEIKELPSIGESAYATERYAHIQRTEEILLNNRFIDYWVGNGHRTEDLAEIPLLVMYMDDESYFSYLKELGLSSEEFNGRTGNFVTYAQIDTMDPSTQRFVSFGMFREGLDSLSMDIFPAYEVEGLPRPLNLSLTSQLPSMAQGPNMSGVVLFAPFSSLDAFEDYFTTEHELIRMLFRRADSEEGARASTEMNRFVDNALLDGRLEAMDYSFSNQIYMEAANRNILLVMNIFIYGFTGIISLITIANVFNTITTNIHLRRREFAMLKSVGMKDGSLRKMMSYECIIYGLKSLLYALPVSVGITWLLWYSSDMGVDTPFALPWTGIAISVFSVFFVIFVTMIYSVAKLKKENTVDVLRSDID